MERREVMEHISASNRTAIAGPGVWKTVQLYVELHEALKAEAGFYDVDFEGDPDERERRIQNDRLRLARAIGFDFDNRITALDQPIDHPRRPALQYGGDIRFREGLQDNTGICGVK